MSSEPWSSVDPTGTLQDDDSVMLLVPTGATPADKNKRATLATLKSFIVDQTAAVPIFSGIEDNENLFTGSNVFFPLSGNSPNTGTGTESEAVQIVPIDTVYRNLTVVVVADTASAAFDVDLMIAGNVGLSINVPVGSAGFTLQSTGSAVGAKGDPIFLRVRNILDGVVRLNGISCTVDVPISGGLATEFTWAASDEDSAIITGILYTTEASNVTKPLSEVILSLKNAPTGTGPDTPIEVNIIQEDGPNTNDFPAGNTIFSINPQIQVTEFTSLGGSVPGTISGGSVSWEEGNRLQILLTLNDSNAAATGLKVSLL